MVLDHHDSQCVAGAAGVRIDKLLLGSIEAIFARARLGVCSSDPAAAAAASEVLHGGIIAQHWKGTHTPHDVHAPQSSLIRN